MCRLMWLLVLKGDPVHMSTHNRLGTFSLFGCGELFKGLSLDLVALFAVPVLEDVLGKRKMGKNWVIVYNCKASILIIWIVF